MTADAVRAWHDGLTPAIAAESAEWLTAELGRRGLFFGDRPLCNVLRPRFLSVAEYDTMRSRIAVLLRAFATALHAALENPRILDQFRLEPWERTLATEPLATTASPVSRLDAFFSPDDGKLRFTEYNAETPAGAGYNDALTELFQAIPVQREFRRRFAPTRPSRRAARSRSSVSSTGARCRRPPSS